MHVDYIEGGWPGSNVKDNIFFKEMKQHSLQHSKLAAFSSTRRKSVTPDKDKSLDEILASGVGTAVIFGKSWKLHVSDVLKVSDEENLNMIYDTVSYLVSHGLEVIYDAEHFYQGFLSDKEYALRSLKSAEDAGSATIVLADTNGGTIPSAVSAITREVSGAVKSKLGVHMHNDSGCAVANTIAGVEAGAVHIQGTINGLGERTGNADIVQLLPTLSLKMGYSSKSSINLHKLKDISLLVDELSMQGSNPRQPYVGANAFAHKAGVHADAMLKNSLSYEHIVPELVGNKRVILLSEVSGASNLIWHAEKLGISLTKDNEKLKDALSLIKKLEEQGYEFDSAPASAMLILLSKLGLYNEYVALQGWEVVSNEKISSATVKTEMHTGTGRGDGPVNAIDNAIRSAFGHMCPAIMNVRLIDYKVVLPGKIRDTESIVRVLTEFTDGSELWRTVGISQNIIQASVQSLLDGFNYYMWLQNRKAKPEVQDTNRVQ
jgi:2-isopropylmalate synthase